MPETRERFDWAQARQAIEDLRSARDVPASEFPGHKEIYCSNLEGFLGERFPALLAERDELVAERRRLRALVERLVATTDLRAAPDSVKRDIRKVLVGDDREAPDA